jgi:hypothetical protein
MSKNGTLQNERMICDKKILHRNLIPEMSVRPVEVRALEKW